MTTKSTALRTQFREAHLITVAGAHDALSARLVEAAGFNAVWAGGFGISTVYGVPDAGILTMTESLEAAQRMNEATALPVIADCDTGFGDVTNVVHMVRKYESSGIAAVCIEDQRFPKVNSFATAGQTLAPIEEFVEKLRAAKAAQRSADLMVFARTEALIAGSGQEEAQRRARAYLAAGADALVIHSKARTSSEVRAFLLPWQRRGPVVVIPTTYPDVTMAELEHLGVKMVIYANQAIRAATKMMADVLATIMRSGSSAPVEATLVSVDELLHLFGTDAIERRAA